MPSQNRAKFVVEEYSTGYGWVLKVRGEVVAKSAKTYRNKSQVRKSVESFVRHSSSASIEDE